MTPIEYELEARKFFVISDFLEWDLNAAKIIELHWNNSICGFKNDEKGFFAEICEKKNWMKNSIRAFVKKFFNKENI